MIRGSPPLVLYGVVATCATQKNSPALGIGVGSRVGTGVGVDVGKDVGSDVGSRDGAGVGGGVGVRLGTGVGAGESGVGKGVGAPLGCGEGNGVGFGVGDGVGIVVGAVVSSNAEFMLTLANVEIPISVANNSMNMPRVPDEIAVATSAPTLLNTSSSCYAQEKRETKTHVTLSIDKNALQWSHARDLPAPHQLTSIW